MEQIETEAPMYNDVDQSNTAGPQRYVSVDTTVAQCHSVVTTLKWDYVHD